MNSHRTYTLCLSSIHLITCNSKIELFSSCQVTIRVEGRDFRLPKDLLCYTFDQKLNGDDNGSGEKIVCVLILPYGSLETFGLVIQWIFTSNIVLPTLQQHLLRRQSEDAKQVVVTEEDATQKTNVNTVDLTSEGLFRHNEEYLYYGTASGDE
jgi:hypothetical protein